MAQGCRWHRWHRWPCRAAEHSSLEGCRGWKMVARRTKSRRLRNTISVYLSAKRSCHHPALPLFLSPLLDNKLHSTSTGTVLRTTGSLQDRVVSLSSDRFDRISIVVFTRRHLRPNDRSNARRVSLDFDHDSTEIQAGSSAFHSYTTERYIHRFICEKSCSFLILHRVSFPSIDDPPTGRSLEGSPRRASNRPIM